MDHVQNGQILPEDESVDVTASIYSTKLPGLWIARIHDYDPFLTRRESNKSTKTGSSSNSTLNDDQEKRKTSNKRKRKDDERIKNAKIKHKDKNRDRHEDTERDVIVKLEPGLEESGQKETGTTGPSANAVAGPSNISRKDKKHSKGLNSKSTNMSWMRPRSANGSFTRSKPTDPTQTPSTSTSASTSTPTPARHNKKRRIHISNTTVQSSSSHYNTGNDNGIVAGSGAQPTSARTSRKYAQLPSSSDADNDLDQRSTSGSGSGSGSGIANRNANNLYPNPTPDSNSRSRSRVIPKARYYYDAFGNRIIDGEKNISIPVQAGASQTQSQTQSQLPFPILPATPGTVAATTLPPNVPDSVAPETMTPQNSDILGSSTTHPPVLDAHHSNAQQMNTQPVDQSDTIRDSTPMVEVLATPTQSPSPPEHYLGTRSWRASQRKSTLSQSQSQSISNCKSEPTSKASPQPKSKFRTTRTSLNASIGINLDGDSNMGANMDIDEDGYSNTVTNTNTTNNILPKTETCGITTLSDLTPTPNPILPSSSTNISTNDNPGNDVTEPPKKKRPKSRKGWKGWVLEPVYDSTILDDPLPFPPTPITPQTRMGDSGTMVKMEPGLEGTIGSET